MNAARCQQCQHSHLNLVSQCTHRIVISYVLDLFIVICSSQLSQALRVESTTVWKELGTVLLGQLCAERVDGDDEGSTVCFKLQDQCIGEERRKMRETIASQLSELPLAKISGDKRKGGGRTLTSRIGHMASAVVPPNRVQNL